MGHRRPYLVSIAVAVMVLAIPLSCLGQYYPGAPSPYPPTQYYAYPQPYSGYAGYGYPYYYYLTPSPQIIHRWEDYRRWLEYNRFQRSHPDSESTFDHMMRTFW